MQDFEFIKTASDFAQSRGLDVQHPIIVFELGAMGINAKHLAAAVGPTFQRLPWDWFDVLLARLSFLESLEPSDGLGLAEALECGFEDAMLRDPFQSWVDGLSEASKVYYYEIAPYRRRSMSTFHAGKTEEGRWHIRRVANQPFEQKTPFHFSLMRRWKESSPKLTSELGFTNLLEVLMKWVGQRHPQCRSVRILAHQVSLVLESDSPRSPAPEGLHKAGADYIITDLVLRKLRVERGTSRVVRMTDGSVILEYELTEGEGLFMQDRPSPHLHDCSPVSGKLGARDTLNFEIHIDH